MLDLLMPGENKILNVLKFWAFLLTVVGVMLLGLAVFVICGEALRPVIGDVGFGCMVGGVLVVFLSWVAWQ